MHITVTASVAKINISHEKNPATAINHFKFEVSNNIEEES